MPASFFDTNVLLYIVSGDAAKADCVERALSRGGVISVQVLNEFTNVARRKMQLSWAETRALLELLRGLLTVHPVTLDIHEAGLDLAERYRMPIYDAMIVASALHAGCQTLLSEDFQNGMVVREGLKITNPFL